MLLHLYDKQCRLNLLPLTYTRTSADIRVGILTLREKWEQLYKLTTANITEEYLQEIYASADVNETDVIVLSNIVANDEIVQWINSAQHGTGLFYDEQLIAAKGLSLTQFEQGQVVAKQSIENVVQINNLWDIFSLNDKCLRSDFTKLTQGRVSANISQGNTLIGTEIFAEEGAKVYASTLNSTSGPIYLAKDSEIMEGSIVRGGLAMCEGAVLKLGTKIYGATTLGPGCKVGGEVNNAVFFANSSKAHDGFIGNAVIGEWCNLGADTNCSNLKNNYEEVKLWSEQQQRFVKTGLQFCGLIMADHSKCGINTMFNTGTVVGVSANIFGAGFPRNTIPSFSWGGPQGITEYKLDKAMQTMQAVFARRHKQVSEPEQKLYAHLFELTQTSRRF
jgi:UDP-N-acetylglucosamine diphosphorylase/glucosamine-1-phosphate N-acetyltransferase